MDLKSRLTLDGSDFSQTINQAGDDVAKFNKTTEDANKTINDLGKTSKKTASELLNQMKSMEGLGRSTGNYRSQLAQMTKQIQDLTVNYRAMSDEMKNSDFGREVAAKIQELTKEASKMKDSIQDASAAVKLLASDTSRLDAAKKGIQGLSAAFSLVASAGILGADSTEKMVKVMARLKAIESATNAVITIANVLNKDSILMLTIKNAQTKLGTLATTKYATATGAATVAQTAFNAAAKANPYVLLASVILTVVGALAAFTGATDDATDAQQDFNKELKKGVDLNESYKNAYSSTISSLMISYNKLQTAWKKLKTELEKTEFIKRNADEFRKLGIEVNNVTDAENVLVANSDTFVRVLTLRAEAAANAAVAMDALKAAYDIDLHGFEDRLPQAGDLVPKDVDNPRRYGLAWDHVEADGLHNDYRFTKEGAELYIIQNKLATKWVERKKLIDKANRSLDKQIDTERELANLENQFLPSSSAVNNNNAPVKVNVEPQMDENSLAAWQKKVQDIQNELNRMDPNNPMFQTLLDQLEEAKKKVKEIQDQMQRPVQFNVMEQFSNLTVPDKGVTLKQAEQQVNHLKSLLEDMDPDSILAAVVAKSLQEWEKKVNDIRQKYAQLGVTVEDVGDKQEETTYTMQDWYGSLNNIIGAFGNINSGISSIYERWKGFEEAVEGKNPFETILYTIDSLLSTLNSVVSIIQTINKLQQLFNMFETVTLALKKKETAESAKGAIIEAAQTGTKSTNAGLDATSAISSVISSASKTPYVGWILALAAAAAVIGLIASAKSSAKFAQGGIVPGTSFIGDKVSAQLNSGEMVLNTQQQRNLFDMLNGKSNGTGGQVEFVIKGQDLKGVLRNYDIKSSRI